MAKKKGKKYLKKAPMTQVKFEEIPLDQVVEKGDKFLSSGNVREALKAFKYLKKMGHDPEIVSPRLFQAYLVRYEQLLEKKMTKEADFVLASAVEFLPAGESISLEVLKPGLRFLPLEKGVALYGDYLSCKEPIPELDRLIGNRAVLEDGLDTLGSLPGDSALFCEKNFLEKAITSMNAGLWDKALKELQPISRKSPFSDIKIFAKLMASFVNNDKQGMQRALSMLGKDFPMTSVTELLSSYAGDERIPSGVGHSETATLLWGNYFLNKSHAMAFKKGVDNNNPLAIRGAVEGLVSNLAPSDSGSAIEFLAEVAGQGVMAVTQEESSVKALFQKMPFSKARQKNIFAKFIAPKGHFFNDYVKEFWKDLGLLFPDMIEQNMARAFVLIEIAGEIIQNPEKAFSVKGDLNALLGNIGFGDKVCIKDQESPDMLNLVALSIVEQALLLDPENQDGYGLILKLPFDSPLLRKALPAVLETMSRVFAEDPRPCLRLGEVYSSKSSVRKAEAAFKEAFKRAPHDGEVKERYAISHMISANKNLKLNKYEIASRDLDVAAAMGITSLGIYLAEKRLLCDLIKTFKFSKELFEEVTCGFTLAETLKVLALFKTDLEDLDFSVPGSPRGLAGIFNDHKKRINGLTSMEIVYLLKPVGDPFKDLFFRSDCASWFIERSWKILSLLTSGDLIDIALDLAENGAMEQVVKELSRRINSKSENDIDLISIKFLYLALTHIQGARLDSGSFSFIIDSATQPVRERLRLLSRRVAAIAPDHLRMAYEQFDFSLLDNPFMGQKFPFDINPGAMNEFAEMMKMLMGELMDEVIDLDDFRAEKVFGKGVKTKDVYDLVYDLVDEAQWLMENIGSPEQEIYDENFMDSFEALLKVVRKKGFNSPDDFMGAGQRFARDVFCAIDVLTAFQAVGKANSKNVSKDVLNFIMGMNRAI